ncbi:unnamed protein product, partial [Rotaria sp. Silwood1]
MQQDAHEFLNHLLNTCGDILLAEKKEEKDKHDKQRYKSINFTINNNDEQYNRITASINLNINNDITTIHNSLIEETWIHELFQGTLVSTTKCLNCET